jgi:uroporphyrin-III C-methyltransferase
MPRAGDPVAAPPAAGAPEPAAQGVRLRTWHWAIVAALALVSLLSLMLAWQSQQRVQSLEQELVRRQQGSAEQANEARVLARQSLDMARDAAAKVALTDARVAEVAVQRTQLEELMQSMSRSRDENAVTDIDAAIRVALQQTSITGSVEPLVNALRTADERLARLSQPRLEGVRRAIARDLERVRGVGVPDIGTLVIKLDDAVRLVDEIPLLSVAAPMNAPGAAPASAAAGSGLARTVPKTKAAAPAAEVLGSEPAAREQSPWWHTIQRPAQQAWDEVRSLLRVTRIDHPEAMLVAPEQSYFVRENLKLRLLNARLAVLSRQYETAQADLQMAGQALARYFDGSSRKTTAAAEIVRQAAAQARLVSVPRPDDTFAALATAAAGR